MIWQKLIRPLLQPGAPAFFLLDEAVPWQKQVLIFLRDAWKEVADEPFDYENRVRYHLSAALRLLSTQCKYRKKYKNVMGSFFCHIFNL